MCICVCGCVGGCTCVHVCGVYLCKSACWYTCYNLCFAFLLQRTIKTASTDIIPCVFVATKSDLPKVQQVLTPTHSPRILQYKCVIQC